MDGRLFGLDAQLLFDAITMFIYIMVLFVILSSLFFKPVRQFMEKRQEGIDQNKTEADEYMNRAEKLKAEYEEKLKQVHKEAESLMSASRRQAHRRQEDVIEAAKEKASAIMTQAQQEACQEKNRVKDEVKQEMAEIAGLLAGQFVESSDRFREAMLVEETLKEMGGDAWQN